MSKRGLILLYTGDGKGKTTAALGMALRALGHGQKVLVIQFMKGDPGYGEVKIAHHLPGLEVIQSGLPTFVKRKDPGQKDLELAQKGLQKAITELKQGRYDLIILDEINVAIDYGLCDLQTVIDALNDRSSDVNVVCTGRYAPQQLIDLADTVSRVEMVKHHYEQNVSAQEGVEY